MTHLVRLGALAAVFAASVGSIPPFESSGRIGDVLLLGATTMCLWGVLRSNVRTWTSRIFSVSGFWLTTFLAAYAVSTIAHPSMPAFKHTAQVGVVSVIFLFFSTLDREFVTSRSVRLLTFLYVLYLVAAVFLVNQRLGTGDLVIKNAVGGAVLGGLGLMLQVYVARRESCGPLVVALPIYLITGIVLGMFVDHRMMLALFALTVPICSAVYLVWNQPLLRGGIFWGTVAFIVLNVWLNVMHQQFGWSQTIHDASVDLVGRRFFSGRDYIWTSVLQEVRLQPWLGHGAGVVPSTLINSELSSHNLYLQILLQVGIVGLIPLVMFFSSVFKSVFSRPRTAAGIVALANIIGVMIYNCYEVVLTQNTLAVAFIEWVLIGLAFVVYTNAPVAEKTSGDNTSTV